MKKCKAQVSDFYLGKLGLGAFDGKQKQKKKNLKITPLKKDLNTSRGHTNLVIQISVYPWRVGAMDTFSYPCSCIQYYALCVKYDGQEEVFSCWLQSSWIFYLLQICKLTMEWYANEGALSHTACALTVWVPCYSAWAESFTSSDDWEP